MIALAGFALAYTLWIFYLAVMNLQRARDAGALTGWAYRLGLPVLYVGLVIDFLTNILVLTVIMLEFPREYLVTARLTRLARAGGYRQVVAQWLAVNLLDAFDPSGKHIK